MYTITCPQCSQPIQYGDHQAGQTANCPRCQVLLQLPFPQPAQSAAPQPFAPPMPVRPGHPGHQRSGSGARIAIIVGSSVGGVLLLAIIIVILVSVFSGPEFPVPTYFTKATKLEPHERMMADNPIAQVYIYDSEGKTLNEVLDFFAQELPKRGWSGGRMNYRKGFKKALSISSRGTEKKKYRIVISVVDLEKSFL